MRMPRKESAMKSEAYHKKRVLRLAERFSQVYVTSVGFGGPVARAGGLLNEAVEQWIAARRRTKQPPTARGEHE
jgi:hypothetical protein